jgi:hypothetical protein
MPIKIESIKIGGSSQNVCRSAFTPRDIDFLGMRYLLWVFSYGGLEPPEKEP